MLLLALQSRIYIYISEVTLIRPVWKHGPRSLVWMHDFLIQISIIAGNLDRVFLNTKI